MIVCSRCGHQELTGAKFCASCGAYLAFVGEEVPVSPDEAQPESSEAVTVAAGEPATPAPVLPGDARTRPAPVVRAGAPVARPGDLFCPECGEPNDPARRFCQECGTTLADAEVAPQPGWWARLVGRFRSGPVPAGTRRRASGGSGRRGPRRWVRSTAGKVVLAAAALGALLTVLPVDNPVRSWVGDTYTSVRRRVAPRPEPVRPVTVNSSSEASGHPASNLIDRTQAWWAEGDVGACETQTLTFEFDPDRPADLYKVGVHPGASGADFAANPRPRLLRLNFADGSSKELRLTDSDVYQTFGVDKANVTTLVVELVSSYPEDGAAGDCAIREVDFFTRN